MALPRLSYSKIRTYLTCPKQYYYSYVLKVPFTPNAKMTFGSNLHKAIEEVSKRHDLKSATLEQFESKLDAHWSKEGFSTPEEEEVYRAKASILLERFLQTEKQNPNTLLYAERSFQFPVGGAWVTGRIDRVDQRPDGTWEVVDYKSGQPPSVSPTFKAHFQPAEISSSDGQNAAPMRVANPNGVAVPPVAGFDDGFQLLVYVLAAKDAWDQWPDGTYHYLQDSSRHTQRFSPEQADQAKNQILNVAVKITAEEFPAVNKVDVCKWCPYRARCRPACLEKPNPFAKYLGKDEKETP